MYKKSIVCALLVAQLSNISADVLTARSLKEVTRAGNKYDAVVVLVCPSTLGVKANRVRAAFKSLSNKPVYEASAIKFVLADAKSGELEMIQTSYNLKTIPVLFVLKDGEKEGDELYGYPLMQDMARHIYGVLGDDIRASLEELKADQEQEERSRGGDTTIIYTNYDPYYNPYSYYSWDWPYYGRRYYNRGWSGGVGFYFGGSSRRGYYRGGHRSGGYRGRGGHRGRR